MAAVPTDLLYSKTHEWVQIEGDAVRVGITDHAQDSLGDITFVELPKLGTSVKKGGDAGVIESVKAASDLFSPVTGEVVSLNDSLESAPENINSDPYGSGWLYTVKFTDKSELDSLMDYEAYEKYLETI
ncbi:MAG: glycine cleavage system protein GcvH [Chitinispirillales bacterium]|jgi:glycine cleavage system H protein|nr:glycine cleavage system protein GcvH [Chitinispirillales bacterium]